MMSINLSIVGMILFAIPCWRAPLNRRVCSGILALLFCIVSIGYSIVRESREGVRISLKPGTKFPVELLKKGANWIQSSTPVQMIVVMPDCEKCISYMQERIPFSHRKTIILEISDNQKVHPDYHAATFGKPIARVDRGMKFSDAPPFTVILNNGVIESVDLWKHPQ
jgi:hypothetical protein